MSTYSGQSLGDLRNQFVARGELSRLQPVLPGVSTPLIAELAGLPQRLGKVAPELVKRGKDVELGWKLLPAFGSESAGRTFWVVHCRHSAFMASRIVVAAKDRDEAFKLFFEAQHALAEAECREYDAPHGRKWRGKSLEHRDAVKNLLRDDLGAAINALDPQNVTIEPLVSAKAKADAIRAELQRGNSAAHRARSALCRAGPPAPLVVASAAAK